MSEEVKIEVELRKYLLGLLDAAQTEEIEKNLVSEGEYFQEIQIVEAEIIQDFVDEKLNREEKKAFDENFIITGERREQINFARALRKFVDEKPKTQIEEKPSFFDSLKSFFLSPIPAICSVLVVVGVSIFVWWNYSNKSEVLVALNRSQKNERPTAARISDFDYAPKTEGTRGNDKSENLDLVFAKSRATEAVLKNPTAENYHELGRVFLAEKNFDESIKQFEKAVKLNPSIAKLNNDLGVALMEKGRQKDEGSLELYARANESLEKSLELDKNLKEAYFNRALVIELLNLPNQAKEAWENYLKLDSTSKWADEARKRLKKLEENKPVSKTKEEVLQDFLKAKQANDKEKAWQTLSRNREMITGKLIPQQLAFLFVDSKTSGDEVKAKEALNALVYAGKLEEEKSGDLFWRDLADYYKKVSDEKIDALKQAQDLMREGYKIYQKGNYGNAKSLFEDSKKKLALAGNNIESKTNDYWIGSSLFYSNRINENLAVYQELADFCRKENYKWLLSQVYARIGYSFSSMNQISNALMYPKKSLAIARVLKDESGIRKFSSQIADCYKSVGRFSESLKYLENVLAVDPADLKWSDYEALSGVFFRQKFYKTAFAFEKEAFNKAVVSDSKINQQICNVNLAIIAASQHKYNEAEEFIENSLQIAQNFNDFENREKSLAYSKLQLAHIKRQSQNFDESIKYYTESINFYESSEFILDKYNAYKGRLICFLAQKNKSAFKKELPIIFEMFEKYRTDILEEQNRNSFFNDEQDIYDIAINATFTESDYSEAFDYSEKSRSRSLLDLQKSIAEVTTNENLPEIRFSKNVIEPLSLAQIQTEMPENVQILEFTILNDKVLIWLVTKYGMDVAKSDVSSETLKDMVFTYIDLISKNKDVSEQRKFSKKLYQTLITPIKDKLKPDKEIFVIPDEFLFRLPFVTLFSDKYFIEEYKISLAPSANAFIISSRKAKEFSKQDSENLLSIGNPTFNREVFEGLEPLPSAGKEAIKIAEFYDESLILTEMEATKELIKRNLGKSDVIHFAGHYVADEDSPLLSGFVLAGNDKETASLANYEIIGEKLLHTRLIVLSACQTGIEKYYSGEGMIGASRTFLATGVPLVVASQWQIDSEASAKLMTEFHRRRKVEKLSTAEALRQTQIAMLQDNKYQQTYYWAAFMTIGGYTQF